MLLDGKLGLILGVANKRSIAWGIAQAAQREGARLALTYQGERLGENVRELAQALHEPLLLPCDVTRDEDLDQLFAAVEEALGRLRVLVSAVARCARRDLLRRSVRSPRARATACGDVQVRSRPRRSAHAAGEDADEARNAVIDL